MQFTEGTGREKVPWGVKLVSDRNSVGARLMACSPSVSTDSLGLDRHP